MKTIRTLLTTAVAITLAQSTLSSSALGDDSQAESAAAPMAATATMASVTAVAAVGQSGERRDPPAARKAKAATSDAIEPRCERIERIGKFVMTRCN
jgi:hypothetical protein